MMRGNISSICKIGLKSCRIVLRYFHVYHPLCLSCDYMWFPYMSKHPLSLLLAGAGGELAGVGAGLGIDLGVCGRGRP